MPSFGEDWERFSSRHLGEWHGRSLALSTTDGSFLSAVNYRLSSTSVCPSQTNPSSLLLKCQVRQDSDEPTQSPPGWLLRYNLDKFHCFADGSYSADHALTEIPMLLPETKRVTHYAIEIALPVSATERIRTFLLYDKERILEAVLLLEEVRSGLFDTREPLALTTLVGEWKGLSQTFRHEPDPQRAFGFGRDASRQSPTRRARREYSDEDLPPQLKDPSGGSDGLIKSKTVIRFGLDPANGKLRRSTVLRDMQDNELGQSVVYGTVEGEAGRLFDMARLEAKSATESVLIPMNNATFVVAPVKRVRGVPAAAELGCLITPGFRRRLVRMYGKASVVSETLSSESTGVD